MKTQRRPHPDAPYPLSWKVAAAWATYIGLSVVAWAALAHALGWVG